MHDYNLRSFQRARNSCSRYPFAVSRFSAPTRRNPFTSRSCPIVNERSIRPLACGEWAAIHSMFRFLSARPIWLCCYSGASRRRMPRGQARAKVAEVFTYWSRAEQLWQRLARVRRQSSTPAIYHHVAQVIWVVSDIDPRGGLLAAPRCPQYPSRRSDELPAFDLSRPA